MFHTAKQQQKNGGAKTTVPARFVIITILFPIDTVRLNEFLILGIVTNLFSLCLYIRKLTVVG